MEQLITFKLKDNLLKQIDQYTDEFGFASRTDFIRNALRQQVEEYEKKRAISALAQYKGFAKSKTSSEELEKIRQDVFNEIEKKFK